MGISSLSFLTLLRPGFLISLTRVFKLLYPLSVFFPLFLVLILNYPFMGFCFFAFFSSIVEMGCCLLNGFFWELLPKLTCSDSVAIGYFENHSEIADGFLGLQF